MDSSIDHRAYMPAAWRLDETLGEGGDSVGDGDLSLGALRRHKLKFAGAKGSGDGLARTEQANDYVVLDPLLEAGKAKFNKAVQRQKKRDNEWAGHTRD